MGRRSGLLAACCAGGSVGASLLLDVCVCVFMNVTLRAVHFVCVHVRDRGEGEEEQRERQGGGVRCYVASAPMSCMHSCVCVEVQSVHMWRSGVCPFMFVCVCMCVRVCVLCLQSLEG